MRYTVVSNGQTSFAVPGTKTRDEAIHAAREAMQQEFMRLKQFLVLPLDQYAVRVVRGLYAERLIRELPAPQCTCGDMPPGGTWPRGEEPPKGCPVHGH